MPRLFERIVVCLQAYCEESFKENDFGDFAERNREAARLESRIDSDLNVVLVEKSKLQGSSAFRPLVRGPTDQHGKSDGIHHMKPRNDGVADSQVVPIRHGDGAAWCSTSTQARCGSDPSAAVPQRRANDELWCTL